MTPCKDKAPPPPHPNVLNQNQLIAFIVQFCYICHEIKAQIRSWIESGPGKIKLPNMILPFQERN